MEAEEHMKRTVLEFSIRADAAEPASAVIPRIEKALGCSLQSEWIQGEYVRQGYLLGMKIFFSEWRGIGGAPTFQLHGFAENFTPETAVFVDISLAVIGLLAEHEAGTWRVPSNKEIDAEIANAAGTGAEEPSGE
jgi:hypothetical protein